MNVLYGFLVLVGLQLFGDLLSHTFSLPVPGAVIGMLLLLGILFIRKQVDEPIAVTAEGLIKYIGLLFVPAGAGVSVYLGLIAEQWLVILTASLASTFMTLIACAWLFKWLSRDEDA